MPWQVEMERARRGHRPSLKNWERDGLYHQFPSFVRGLQDHVFTQAVAAAADDDDDKKKKNHTNNTNTISHPPNLPLRLDAQNLDKTWFTETLEQKGIPCIIENIPNVEPGWTSSANWTLENLMADPKLRHRRFKCGEDDDGHSIKVKLKHFIEYCRHNRDDSPLYIFDSNFDDDRKAKILLDRYSVPSYFSDDLFGLVSESRRPPYRWFLVGPKRSGTTLHIDPLATSAWNTLLVGQKRWVLFPPQVPKQVAKGKYLIRDGEDDEAVHYFMTILPRIKNRAKYSKSSDYHNFACYEFTQNAGETVFIPNGWWHAVLNLSDTVGVTQNFCSPRNFTQVWRQTRKGRKLMAAKWYNQLCLQYPLLAQHARELNTADRFVMRYDPNVIRRQDEVRRLQKERCKKDEEHRRSIIISAASSSSKKNKGKNEQQQQQRGSSIVSPTTTTTTAASSSSNNSSSSTNSDLMMR